MDYVKIIEDYYGDQTAKRSGVPLIHHIYEGLAIMEHINASKEAMAAYCLHPMFQSDEEFSRIYRSDLIREIDQVVLALVLEYRKVANGYLCRPHTDNFTLVDLRIYAPCPIRDVQHMLIADKVQNRKDFEEHHLGSHERSDELRCYFIQWLAYFNIGSTWYNSLRGVAENATHDWEIIIN